MIKVECNIQWVNTGTSRWISARYCQDPRKGRIDSKWRTKYCKLSCIGGHKKMPLSCETLGGRRESSIRHGTTCLPSQAKASKCTGLGPPNECTGWWHCRNPHKAREDLLWKREYCALRCQFRGFAQNAKCPQNPDLCGSSQTERHECRGSGPKEECPCNYVVNRPDYCRWLEGIITLWIKIGMKIYSDELKARSAL